MLQSWNSINNPTERTRIGKRQRDAITKDWNTQYRSIETTKRRWGLRVDLINTDLLLEHLRVEYIFLSQVLGTKLKASLSMRNQEDLWTKHWDWDIQRNASNRGRIIRGKTDAWERYLFRTLIVQNVS